MTASKGAKAMLCKLILSTFAIFACFIFTESLASSRFMSWGKARVTRSEYDNDSINCSIKAMQRDVRGDKETRKYLQGFEVLERENNQPPMPTPPGETFVHWHSEKQVLLRRMYRPDMQVDALQSKLTNEVQVCLLKLGYTPFLLSKTQERQLRKYPTGTEARRSFLFGLATNPEIVAAQKVK